MPEDVHKLVTAATLATGTQRPAIIFECLRKYLREVVREKVVQEVEEARRRLLGEPPKG